MAVRAEESGGMSTPLLCYLKWTGDLSKIRSDLYVTFYSMQC